MNHDQSLAEGLFYVYGQVIEIEGIGPDFEARASGTDGFTLLHKPCWQEVERFGEEAQTVAIIAAQEAHECHAQSGGAGVE